MKNIIKTYLGLPKSIYILCCATLINRLGDFVVPFLTLFLTQKLNMSTGLKTRVSEYSEEIKSDRYYFIDTYQTNPDGTIQTIVISSDNGKYR